MNRKTVKETAGKIMVETQQNGGTKMKIKINRININYYQLQMGNNRAGNKEK